MGGLMGRSFGDDFSGKSISRNDAPMARRTVVRRGFSSPFQIFNTKV
jgi:hypothetical protein